MNALLWGQLTFDASHIVEGRLVFGASISVTVVGSSPLGNLGC
jgi:hypothetical protein